MGLKEMHHFHEHETEKHCEAEGVEQHFHGEEYAFNHCELCDYNFSEPQLSDSFQLPFIFPPIGNNELAYYLLPYFSNDLYSFPSRGPPSQLA